MGNTNTKIISYLKILELPINRLISEDIVKEAYRILAKKYHPDVADSLYKDGKKFVELQEAKDYLLGNIDYVNTLIRNHFSSSSSEDNRAYESWKQSNNYYKQSQQSYNEEKRRQEEQKRQDNLRRAKEAEERRRQEEQAKREKSEKLREQRISDAKVAFGKINKADYYTEDYNRIISFYNAFIKFLRSNNSLSSEQINEKFFEFQKNIKSVKTIAEKKENRRIAIILSSILGAVVIVLILTFKVFIPMSKYNNAKEFAANGKYDEAIDIFNDIESFSDSQNQIYIAMASAALDSNDYQLGIDYIKKIGGKTSVIYDANGGEISGSNTASREGYTFAGWLVGDYKINDKKDYQLSLTLVANWDAIMYSISYDLDGGSSEDNVLKTSYNTDISVSIPNINKEGFLFMGWIYGENSEPKKDLIISKGTTGNIILKAVWVPIDYYITFILNNGQMSEDNIMGVSFDSTFVLPTPNREGYEFDGWYISNTKVVDDVYKWNDNITLEAKWSLKNYDITLDLDGGVASNKSSYTMEDALVLTNPQKDGYTFIGWRETDTSELLLTVSIKKGSIGDKYYKAYYKANNYIISFNVNNGDSAVDSIIVEFDSTPNLISPKRVGYTFVGWYYNSKVFDGKMIYSKDIELKAEWTPNTNTKYQIKYYRENIDNNDYTLYESIDLFGTTDTFVSPEPKNYVGFVSPSAKQEKIKRDGSTIITYYYAREKYDVIFTTNGGTVVDKITKKYESTIEDSITTSKYNYTFDGWFLEESLKNKYNHSQISNDMVLYAGWKEENKPSDFNYILDNNYYCITEYIGTSEICSVPEYIGGVIVKKINDRAISYSDTITELRIPNTIDSLDLGTFAGLSTLEKIVIPFVGDKNHSLNEHYQYPFGYIFGTDSYYGSTKTDQRFIEGFTASSEKIFRTTTYYIPSSLREVVIRNSDNILWGAFYNCNILTNISISDKCNYVDGYAFYYCSNLEEFVVPNSATHIGPAFEGCSKLKKLTIPFVGIEKQAINDENQSTLVNLFTRTYFPNSMLVGEFYVSNTLEEINVTSGEYLPAMAFAKFENIKKITLPDGLKVIGSDAFFKCHNLEELIIPESVESIKNNAFNECTSLKSLFIPKNIIEFEGNSFSRCSSLESIVVSNENKKFDSRGDCNAIIETQSNKLLLGCVNTVIPEEVSIIGRGAFSCCVLLKTINIPSNILEIEDDAFSDCLNLKTVTIEAELLKIPNSAFSGCEKLETINIPNSVKIIGSYAFRECRSLVSIYIPKNVTNIEEGSFSNCVNIIKVFYGGSYDEWQNLPKGLYNENIRNAEKVYNS